MRPLPPRLRPPTRNKDHRPLIQERSVVPGLSAYLCIIPHCLMSESILIKGGTLLTMDQKDSIVAADLFIKDGRIESIADPAANAGIVIDASGCAVLPGFIQTHIHLCQTIFRGAADDLSLLDWLKKRVWPLEAAHDAGSIRASARLGVAELIQGGTTCALT